MAEAYRHQRLHGIAVGSRIELHPGTDAWMQGDRYGAVVKVGRKYIHVRMDKSGYIRRCRPADIFTILD